MKIDKNKLVDLLVDKTSMGKNEVENQLEQLIERIIDAANRGKALEIKDFGHFYFDKSGELKFDPSKELSTEISFKYAGMKPVEIQPERDTAISLSGEDEEPIKDPFDEIEEEDTAEIKQEAIEEDFPEAADDDEDDMFDFLSEAVKEDEQEIDIWDEVAKEEAAEKRKSEEAKKKTAGNPKLQSYQRKKNNSVIWVIAAIILLLVLGGLYLYFMDADTIQEDSFATAGTEQQDPIPEELSVITDEIAEESLLSEEFENETEQEQTESVTGNVDIASPAQIADEQSTYGLLGSIVEDANNGYSIVLHSFNSEENARTAATQLSEDGYRVLVSSRAVAEGAMWRVSVGQFRTLNDALSNINRLPPPYNTQNFIHRIQNN